MTALMGSGIEAITNLAEPDEPVSKTSDRASYVP